MSAGKELLREFIAYNTKKTHAPEAFGALVDTDEYVKLLIVSNFIDYHIGHHILPHHPSGTCASVPMLVGLEQIMEITASSDFSSLLNKRITVGSNTSFVHIYR